MCPYLRDQGVQLGIQSTPRGVGARSGKMGILLLGREGEPPATQSRLPPDAHLVERRRRRERGGHQTLLSGRRRARRAPGLAPSALLLLVSLLHLPSCSQGTPIPAGRVPPAWGASAARHAAGASSAGPTEVQKTPALAELGLGERAQGGGTPGAQGNSAPRQGAPGALGAHALGTQAHARPEGRRGSPLQGVLEAGARLLLGESAPTRESERWPGQPGEEGHRGHRGGALGGGGGRVRREVRDLGAARRDLTETEGGEDMDTDTDTDADAGSDSAPGAATGGASDAATATGGTPQAASGAAPVRDFEPCDARWTDYTPCEDPVRANGFSRTHMQHRERHCPSEEEQGALQCLVPPPVGYKVPLPWPRSRDEAWYVNVPYKHLTLAKADQNWVQYDEQAEKFVFPGGGTTFHEGAAQYISELAKILPLPEGGGSIRTALDTGCGVGSFGAYMLDRGVLTMSLAPRDGHEAQVQFALERGLPAMLGILATKRLPFPSRAFDLAHCSRCLIPWAADGGKFLAEIDRVLRPGGFWVLTGPPIHWRRFAAGWKRSRESLRAEQGELERAAEGLCWEKYREEGIFGVWRKPAHRDASLCLRRKRKKPLHAGPPPLCPPQQDPDFSWYTPMSTCISQQPHPSEAATPDSDSTLASDPKEAPLLSSPLAPLAPWPRRLWAVPPRVRLGSVPGLTGRVVREDTREWRGRVGEYKARLLPQLGGGEGGEGAGEGEGEGKGEEEGGGDGGSGTKKSTEVADEGAAGSENDKESGKSESESDQKSEIESETKGDSKSRTGGESESVSDSEGENESGSGSERGGDSSSRRRLQAKGTRYRNIMDMNAGAGGFATALYRDPVWVMNVIPVEREGPPTERKGKTNTRRGLDGAGADSADQGPGVDAGEGAGGEGKGGEERGGGRGGSGGESGAEEPGREARRLEGGLLGVVYERGLIGTFHDWCEAFSTYPRTYDLLHAAYLFTNWQSRQNPCPLQRVLLEMDRILRPEGAALITDEPGVLRRLLPIAKAMRWDARIEELQTSNRSRTIVGRVMGDQRSIRRMEREGQKGGLVLVCIKKYWTAG